MHIYIHLASSVPSHRNMQGETDVVMLLFLFDCQNERQSSVFVLLVQKCLLWNDDVYCHFLRWRRSWMYTVIKTCLLAVLHRHCRHDVLINPLHTIIKVQAGYWDETCSVWVTSAYHFSPIRGSEGFPASRFTSWTCSPLNMCRFASRADPACLLLSLALAGPINFTS